MFGFPKSQRKTFVNTFIRKVELIINFSPVDKGELMQCAEKCLQKNFPNIENNLSKDYKINLTATGSPEILVNSEAKGLKLISEDRKKVLFVDNGLIKYVVDGDSYMGYEDMVDTLKDISTIFESLKIVSLQKISLQKINIFGFETKDTSIDALKDLISLSLLGNNEYFPNSNDIKQNVNSIIYNNDVSHLNIIYGLYVPPSINLNEVKKGQVIVDINISHTSSLLTVGLWDKMNELNDELFNVFNWVINDNARKLLDNN
ncbi:MAG: TIGR04255 family protein [bacterium]